ncbi:MAG: 50S ribosomal protein L30 [Candidatus Marinimicrobia bacterium]|nr:50S ribosomal protein L30 [Candidatus Neomarinimicrobiota bacterium]MCF7827490.1 50S ribosomal protein L30 [Candidatus Neomarinimicrobiota bacterium]MCF7882380.1 50S ribosomal protein L30 [Candidatus Neomarinimicrobiota bacterium]
MAKKKQLQIRQKKSVIGVDKKQKATVRALGLRRNYRTVVHDDTPAIRGMIAKVQHLVDVEEV